MVFINLDRFAEAGLTPPEPDWRFQDFLNAAVTLSGEGGYGFATRNGAYGDLLFVLQGLGACLYDPEAATDPDKLPWPTFDDPTVVAALGHYADLSRRQALSPRTPSTQSGWPNGVVIGGYPAGVETGDVAMWVDRISYQAFAPVLPFETGIAPLPVEARDRSDLSIKANYISSHAATPQACWDWLTFLNGQPTTVEFIPAARSVADSVQWQQQVGKAALPAYVAILEYANAPIRPEAHWASYAFPWLDEAFQAAVAGEDPGRALGEAQAKTEIFVACLETTGSPSAHNSLRACARQADPDYPLADADR
jgi:ABC-type glycerol-3-phosphate transport system substrate-binding protein